MPIEGASDQKHRVRSWPDTNASESGNMLIMVLSYTQRTNDTSLINNYVGTAASPRLASCSLAPMRTVYPPRQMGPVSREKRAGTGKPIRHGELGGLIRQPDESSYQRHYRYQGHVGDCGHTGRHGESLQLQRTYALSPPPMKTIEITPCFEHSQQRRSTPSNGRSLPRPLTART